MEKSFFFNSVNGDRKVNANDFREYFYSFIGDGIFPVPSDNLQIMSNNDMTVTLKEGKGWIKGALYQNTNDYIFRIDTADGVANRIDRVILKFDTLERKIYTYVKKGTFATEPTPPAIERNADVFELCLAEIYVAAGAISINQNNITDTRLSNDLCGIVHTPIEKIDITTLYNQYTEGFKIKQNQFETQFIEWFKNIQGALDGDIATNIINKVTKLEGNINNMNEEINTTKETIRTINSNIKNIFTIIEDYKVLKENWVFNNTNKLYEYKIVNENIRESSIVDVNFKIGYQTMMKGLLPMTTSFNGYVLIYNSNLPNGYMKADIKITNGVI